MRNNKEWNGKGLPPVGVKCEFQPNEWSEWKVVKVLFVGSEFAVFESGGGESVWSLRGIKVRPLPPQPKKIDMAKFAGSEFLMGSDDGYVIATENSEALLTNSQRWEPLFNHWNHWTGDSEPEWLEGFNVTVRETMVSNCGTRVKLIQHKRNVVNWPNVVAIKITGVKEGWEL